MTYEQLALAVDLKRAVQETWQSVSVDVTFDSDADRAALVADCFSFYGNCTPMRNVDGETTTLVSPEHVLFVIAESPTRKLQSST